MSKQLYKFAQTGEPARSLPASLKPRVRELISRNLRAKMPYGEACAAAVAEAYREQDRANQRAEAAGRQGEMFTGGER